MASIRRESPNYRPERRGAEMQSLVQINHRPAQLLALGFRNWVAGYRTGNTACWERAWALYQNEIGIQKAQNVVGELSSWVRAVSAAARREIQTCPTECERFCRDECLAVSMVAASQHKTCPAMRACAFALIESELIDEVVYRSDSLALTLRGANQVLLPDAIVGAPLNEYDNKSEYHQ